MIAWRILGSSSDSLLSMFRDLNWDQNNQNQIVKKVVIIAIRCTYYVFCRRNESWRNPELLDFLLFHSFFLSIILYSCSPFSAINFVYHCIKADSQLCTTCYCWGVWLQILTILNKLQFQKAIIFVVANIVSIVYDYDIFLITIIASHTRFQA